MSLFTQRKNKQFNYKPKHLNKGETDARDSLASQWDRIKTEGKRKKSFLTSLPFLVLFLIVVLIVFYILSRYE